MSKVARDANKLPVDADIRSSIEQAKKDAFIDRGSTCFKGKGSLSKAGLTRSMCLARDKAQEEYM